METSFVCRGRLVLKSRILEDGVLITEEDVITGITDAHNPSLSEGGREPIAAVPASDSYVSPGLIDVYCYGGDGSSFPNATFIEKAQAAIDEHRHYRTTTLIASLVTAHADVPREGAVLLTELAEEGELTGIHFGDSFVSHARYEAQDPKYIINPGPEPTAELLEICKSCAFTMTLASEEDKVYGPEFVAGMLTKGNVLPSWDHAGSSSIPAREAFEFSRKAIKEITSPHGARAIITHLFNGMCPLYHRDTGPTGGFLSGTAGEGVTTEMICDGIYLDPSLVHDVYGMLGRDSYIFVTDAVEVVGMLNGTYELGSQMVDVEDGYTYTTDTTALTGGTTHLLDCVCVATFKGGINLVDAVFVVIIQGTRILGRYDIDELEAGMRADVLELDGQLRSQRVQCGGTLVK